MGYPPPQLACVYALEMSDGTVKIGVTTNLEKRIKQVSGAVYLDVLNVHHTGFAPLGFMHSVEKECHQTFSNKRVRGEFFDITFEEARAELDRHKEEIDAALKAADQKFLDESIWTLEVVELLREHAFDKIGGLKQRLSMA